MIDLFIVVAASIAAGLLSLSVAIFLLRSEKFSAKLIKYGTPFAAGVLLIIAFRDLLPEAIVEDGADVLNSALGAILIFFLIEKRYSWMNKYIMENDKGIELGCGTGIGELHIKSKYFELSKNI